MGADNQQRRLDVRLGWLGGIIDGEGMITVMKRVNGCSFYPRISIANTNKNLINEASFIFNELGLAYYIQSKTYFVGEKQRIKYELLVNGIRRCIPVLQLVIPYLVAKKENAEKLLSWCLRRNNLGASKYDEEDMKILSIRQRI